MNIIYSEKSLYAPKEVSYNEMEGSFFLPVYQSALSAVNSLISTNRFQKPAEIFHNNNIIAFIGERGSGKTSSMVSFAKALASSELINDKDALFLPHESKRNFDKYQFELLPTIEPSNLSQRENVLDVVISQMYTYFKYRMEEKMRAESSSNPNIVNNSRKLIDSFAQAHDAIRALCGDKSKLLESDTLENLSNIAAGNNIRQIMFDLIENYLYFMHNDCDKKYNHMLILCIDDLDLNPEMGYEICEEIRKYFSINNVIVLFSAKLSQLTDIVKNKFYKQFKELEEKGILSDTVEEMATLYIDKLIPDGRRCAMPSFDVFTFKDVKIIYDDEKDAIEKNLVDEVMNLVFAKTGIILVKNSYDSHDFIPPNLRGIFSLIKVLNDMPDIDIFEIEHEAIYVLKELDENVRLSLESNLIQFENYLRNHLAIGGLPLKLQKLLSQAINANWVSLNQQIVKGIADFDDKLVDRVANSDGSADICGNALPENISIGDALYMLNKARKSTASAEYMRFFSLIKIIYSLRAVRLAFVENDRKSLKRFLGGMIYNPQGDAMVRGHRDWLVDVETDDIYFEDEEKSINLSSINMAIDDEEFWYSDGNADEFRFLMWIDMHTVSTGKYDSRRANVWGRANWNRIYYNIANYTYDYITLSYMPILSVLDKVRSEDDWAIAHNNWQRDYLAIIPVISADFIDEFIQRLPRDIDINLKGTTEGFQYYDAFIKAVKRASIEISQTRIKNHALCEWIGNACSFPFWETEYGVHKNIVGIWYSEDEAERLRTNDLTSTIKKESIRKNIIQRVTLKLSQIEIVSNSEELQNAIQDNFSAPNIKLLSADESKKILSAQQKIRNARNTLKKQPTNANISDMKNDLVICLRELIDTLEAING